MKWPFRKKHVVITTVGAIIQNQQDEDEPRILLTRRGYPPFQNQWCLPGGHIDPSETARQAIIREVKEEVGLDFDARFFCYFDEIIPEQKIHAVVLLYIGDVSGQLQAQPGEVTEMCWFGIEDSLKLSLAFQHNQILEAYKEKTCS